MAVPPPERELQRLRTVIGRGLPQVILLSGVSDWFRGEAFEAVSAALPADADRRTLDGQSEGDGSELDDLRGGGLFGSGSWLLVRRGDAWLKRVGAQLAPLVAKIAPGCGLVLEVGKLDRRTKLAKALGEVGESFQFRDLYREPYDRSRSPLDAEIVGWIVGRAREGGLRLTPDAAFLLMSDVGCDPGELVGEIGRLRGVLGDGARGVVGPEQLRGHLSCSFESTPFEFAEALLAGDRRRCLRSLAAMFARGVKGRDGGTVDSGGVFPFVCSWLHQALVQALRGRELLDRGIPLRDVPGRVGVRAFADRFQEQVRRNDSERLRHGVRELLRVQRELRSTGEQPQLLLERFLSRFFAKDPKTLRRGA